MASATVRSLKTEGQSFTANVKQNFTRWVKFSLPTRDGKIILPRTDISDYKYLIAYGKKASNNGQQSILIYDENGNAVGEDSAEYSDSDDKWRQYLIDVSKLKGKVNIVFHGEYVDSTEYTESENVFSDITLY